MTRRNDHNGKTKIPILCYSTQHFTGLTNRMQCTFPPTFSRDHCWFYLSKTEKFTIKADRHLRLDSQYCSRLVHFGDRKMIFNTKNDWVLSKVSGDKVATSHEVNLKNNQKFLWRHSHIFELTSRWSKLKWASLKSSDYFWPEPVPVTGP